MKDKYVVFVDEELVAGAFQMSAGVGSYGIGAGTGGRAQDLQLRRGILDTVASTLVGGGAGAAAADPRTATAALGSYGIGVAEGTVDPAAQPAPTKGVEILEGINGIVIDEELADFDALQAIDGITIFRNVELHIPEPVDEEEGTAAAAAAPEYWHLDKIGLGQGTTGGEGILIGILDSGIDGGHPEFAGKTIHFKEFDWFGRPVNGPVRDAGDHGTHVSSIAAGAKAGVAPGAGLAVAAVLTKKGPLGMSGSLVQIVTGFNWLMTHNFRGVEPGVDVINASLGGAGFNPYLRPSVQSAFQLGIPLIAAIGNGGKAGVGRHGSPGNYPEVLSVGATDSNDVVGIFSDWGPNAPPTGPKYPVPELCAPGVSVYAAVPGGGYQPKSGTSMATPVVTGIAACRMSTNAMLVGQPAALFMSLRSKLANYHANPLGNQGGAGRIVA